VPQNPANYSFTVLGAMGQPQQNATAQFYFFGNGNYNVTLVNRRVNATSAPNYSAYLGTVGQSRLYRISRVLLYNSSNYAYTAFNATGAQFNYTLMIIFSGTQIEGALIMTDALYSSNLFKLVWLCNQYQCPYSNSSARISPVFINNDTRIYRIVYS